MADIGGNIFKMRTPYRSSTDAFDVDDLVSKEPFKQFENWFEEAREIPDIKEANAMALATATKYETHTFCFEGYSLLGFGV